MGSSPKQSAKKENLAQSPSRSSFPYAIRSFVGYLEGTQKSEHTIKSYRLDIQAFHDFLVAERPDKILRPDQIHRPDLERYRNHLKEKGLKINTRRRKILTVTQFLNYLAKRKKVSKEVAGKFPAPHKVERVPFTVPSTLLIQAIRALPNKTILEARNQCLLWSLAETGCLVSECAVLKYEQWQKTDSESAILCVEGKFRRTVPVSIELYHRIQEFKHQTASFKVLSSPSIFLGFNKFGPLGTSITPRGVELLVKSYGPQLGYPGLTPRTFRHSIILKWFEEGVPQTVIQSWLGLKTTYAFRSYFPLLNQIKSSSETTSNLETD